jgi:hypothetical protein
MRCTRPSPANEQVLSDRVLSLARASLGTQSFEEARARGDAMPLADAVALGGKG